jgi:hypothetical protein
LSRLTLLKADSCAKLQASEQSAAVGILRRVTIARLAILDLSRRRALAGVQLVGLVTTIALATALPLTQAVAAENGLHAALVDLGAGANLQLGLDQVHSRDDFDRFESATGRKVAAELGGVMIPGARVARSNQLQAVSLNGVGLVHEPGDPLPVATYYEDLQAHATVTAGQWPPDTQSSGQRVPAWWASAPEPAAALLGLKVGDVYCLGPSGASRNAPAPWCARVGALWKPKSAADPYWGGQQPGTELTLGADSLFGINAPYVSLHAVHLFVADLGRIHAADASSIRDHLQRVHADFGVMSDATFITGLGDAIDQFVRRLQAQQSLAVSIEIALLAVALYAVGLAATSFLDAQKTLIGLWRARGGSRLRAWALLMVQFAALALIALPAGLLLGACAVAAVSQGLFGSAASFGSSILSSAAPTVAAALAAVAAVVGVLVAGATRRTLAEARRGDSRPATEAWWRRPVVDVALAAGGLLLLAEYRLQAGEITTSNGPDPLGLVLPGVALAMLAAAAIRLLPLVARAVAGGGDVAARLALWRLERQPQLHARVALLLSFALALALFAGAYLATDQRNALDRARYAAGSDVRVWFGFGTAPSVLDATVAGTTGVSASSLLVRDAGRPGRSDVSATVIGLDPYSFPEVADWRSDFAGSSLPQLMGILARGDPDGTPIRGTPKALTMWVYSSGVDATLEAGLTAASGQPLKASFGSLSFAGWRQLEAPLTGGFPLHLRTIAVTPNVATTSGDVGFSDLRAGDAVIEAFAASDGWWDETVGRFGGVGTLKPGKLTHDGGPAVDVPVAFGGGTVALHPAAPAAPLPGIISSATAAKLGVAVGQTFPLHIETNDVPIRLVGTADYFPTLYPGQDDFLVVPMESLLERLRALDVYVYPNEAWLKVAGSTVSAANAATAASHGQAHVSDRESFESEALANPLRRSVDAALVIGFVASLALVVIGFGLHFLAASRSRVGESAIMQANGLPWRVVERALFLEQLAVLCHSVVVGGIVGALLAWAILPVLQTSVLPGDIIPPTIVTLDLRTLLAATLALLASAALVGWSATRAAGRFRLPDELRAIA